MSILPAIDQAPLSNGMNGQGESADGLPNPWNTNTGDAVWGNFIRDYWNTDLAVLRCPSDDPPTNRGESPSLINYKACVGDDYHQNHFRPNQSNRDNRGIFQVERWISFSSVLDGTSNTVLLGEMVGGGFPDTIEGGVALNMQSWNPAACIARVDLTTRRLTTPVRADFRPVGGRAWDGRPYFVGFATMVPPNGPSCHWGGVDGNEHMGTLSSRHEGGGHITLADGSVRFISENIDTGNLAVDDVPNPGGRPSPYGVWGAMGSRNAGEPVSAP